MSNEIKDDKVGCVYGVLMFLVVFAFLGFVIYLIYILISKASSGEFVNTTLLQGMLTILFSVVGGTILSKILDRRNAKSLEIYKIRSTISLKIVELSGIILSVEDMVEKEKASFLLYNENVKVKIFFDDDTVRAVKRFISDKSLDSYGVMTDTIRKKLN